VLIYVFPIGLLHEQGEGTPKDKDIALKYFLLAADQGYMNAIYRAMEIYIKRYDAEGPEQLYNVMYYCRKYIKLSETKEFNKADKEQVTRTLSGLSSICRVCGKKGEGYKYCSKCTCVYYCSVGCQRKDWKENGHKEECKKRLLSYVYI
jgi:TPR repeat protein